MKPLRSIPFIIPLTFICSLLINCTSEEQQQVDYGAVKSGFVTPKPDNTLWCYWYWIGDDISKEGITKDLEAMKKAGIGSAFIGNINPEEKDGRVPMLSEDWWGHMVHAVNEGKRLGVNIGVFNCPGWSQSGGPWIKADMAMRHLVYSEIKVAGGKKINLNLKKPTAIFQDVYVLAFPTIAEEKNILSDKNAEIKISPEITDANLLIDHDTTTVAGFPSNIKNYQIDITAGKYFTVRSLRIKPSIDPIKFSCEVFAKIKGEFKFIKQFDVDRSKLTANVGPDKYAPILESLPKTQARQFRLKITVIPGVFQSETYPDSKVSKWHLAEITLSEAAGLEDYANKDLGKMHPTPFPKWDSYLWPEQPKVSANQKIPVDQVIDISDKMDSQGNLNWEAPNGNWTVQRFGMTPTGTKNAPAAPQGKGYEVDKANKEFVKYHYKHFIGELLKRIPEENKSAFKYVVADSYEMGSENWTDDYEKRFRSQFGYDPKKYLPVLSGRIVGSVEESNRFLWDLRRSIADAVAYDYVGGLREASNKDHLKLWLENYGHWGFPSEFLMYGGQSDYVSGEFWNEGTLGNIECKSASSAAHIYGKPQVSAEAFTAANRTYVRYPALLKKRGDWSYTEGINHFVLHLYIHQPDDNRMPGVNAWFSTEFNRHNTWFKKGKAYFDYLRRCQHLLQQGNYAADVCYFIGENAPIMTGVRNPELPKGYSYDYINAEVILKRLSVKDGKFVLPDGMTYSLMVLPPLKTMRPELLTKIGELVKAGGKIYGQAPERSPSLKNYPECDETVKELADKMWSNTDGKIKKFGDGFIVNGLELQDALKELHVYKDVELNTDADVLWTHRTMPGMEIYFITNQTDQKIFFTPSFRVSGLKPQLWDAVTGEIRALNEFTEKNDRTTVPLTMEPYQSWFIVFTNSKTKTTSYKKNFPKTTVVKTLNESWLVNFKNKSLGPKKSVEFPELTDWIKNENDSIKYYSGTAIYKSKFYFHKENNDKDVFIDLGKVGVMASVKINGQDIGTTWIAPFRLKATQEIKDGENEIEVEVVNVWRNRLTGDKTLPENERTTWVNLDNITPGEALISSGLLGPVTIESIK
ncbi:glycosyl hydrolase [Gaetbulibacter aestuarii]|uniref:Glycosyl hydrolase n=1 Tax=Gaetbulibacter aestuarii TaxID=1502358 RepID=A0ABW7N128_9FLAO